MGNKPYSKVADNAKWLLARAVDDKLPFVLVGAEADPQSEGGEGVSTDCHAYRTFIHVESEMDAVQLLTELTVMCSVLTDMIRDHRSMVEVEEEDDGERTG